ncbi:phosphate/phosphite/phosphonate ABC transporter substrate-binding protein [Candidatus Parcubacteria bacterium]|nr:phosphate/phosphite/phosphonate ABC transporter substrate-binding protein [Candidatus Parcubacteria bacterium]
MIASKKLIFVVLGLGVMCLIVGGFWLLIQRTADIAVETKPVVEPSGDKVHYLGILPLKNPSTMLERFSGVEKYLREQTGLNIKLRLYPTSGAVGGYSAVVRDVANGDISFAFLASVTAAQAHGISGGAVVPFACAQKSGSPVYYGHVAVKQDSSYQKIEDLKGKSVCGSSKSSTSGNLMPTAYLMSKGIEKYDYFNPFEFLGSHDKAAEAVIAGTMEAAFINEATFDGYNQDKVQIRSIYKHPAVPEFPFCVNTKKVTPEELAKVKVALLNMHTSDIDGVKAVEKKYDKWVAINWQDYLGIKEAIANVHGPVFYNLEEWDKLK